MNYDNYDILLMNLKTLDYDLEEKAEYAKLSSTSFNKSNSSLMCNIIRFLLLQHNPEYNEQLRLCYPVVTLKELKDFKECSFQIIESFIPKEKIVGKSVLDNAKGNKLISFLRILSDEVIKSKLQTKYQTDNLPSLIGTGLKPDDNIILQMKKNILLTHIELMKDSIIKKSQRVVEVQNKWKSIANDFVNEIQKLEREQVTLKNKIKNITKLGTSQFGELASIDRAPKIENHKEFIKMIDAIYDKFNKDKEFQNTLGFINENKELYDTISPQNILSKKTEKDNSDIDSSYTNSIFNINITNNDKENDNIVMIHEIAKCFEKSMIAMKNKINEENALKKLKALNEFLRQLYNEQLQANEDIDILQKNLNEKQK